MRQSRRRSLTPHVVPEHQQFKRARMMSAQIEQINIHYQRDMAGKGAALAALGACRSRGKGRGQPWVEKGNKPGRYMPHQGARECARRLAQWRTQSDKSAA